MERNTDVMLREKGEILPTNDAQMTFSNFLDLIVKS